MDSFSPNVRALPIVVGNKGWSVCRASRAADDVLSSPMAGLSDSSTPGSPPGTDASWACRPRCVTLPGLSFGLPWFVVSAGLGELPAEGLDFPALIAAGLPLWVALSAGLFLLMAGALVGRVLAGASRSGSPEGAAEASGSESPAANNKPPILPGLDAQLSFQVLVEHASDLIWSVTRDGHFTYVSPSWDRITGYKPEQLLGRHLAELVHPEDLPRCARYLRSFLQGDDHPDKPEYRVLHADGSWHWHIAGGQAVRDAEGRFCSLVGISRDITHQKLSEERLRQSETRFRNLFENTPAIAVQGYDRHRRVIFWNEASENLYGYSVREAMGRLLEELIIPPPMRPQVIAGIESWIAGGEPIPACELRLQRADGSPVDVFSSHVLMPNYKGEPEMYCVDVDLTGIKQVEEQLRGVNTELEAAVEQSRAMALEAQAASRAKSDFLANMSHEIRTPMTAILGYAELLNGERDDHQGPEQITEAIGTIQRNGRHLLTIINDVLDMSKIESGKMTVERLKISPATLVGEVAEMIRPRLEGKDLSFRLIFETEVPGAMTTDPTRLRQILINLLGNAIKFCERGQITLRVSADRKPTEETSRAWLRIAVEDTGVGMTAEQCQRIARFNPFTQADTSMTRRFGGTGLGLSISNALARLLGGRMVIRSEEGVGSAFTVELPLENPDRVAWLTPEEATAQHREPARAEPAKTEEAGSGAASETPLVGRRILLAEDGPDNQRLISFYLKKAGADVTVAENGRLACEAVEQATAGQGFDLIIMDMQMPELDGYEATRRLRDAGCTLPVVALTAHAMTGDRAKCLDAGCDEYATKPVNRAALVALCREMIESGRARKTESR